MVTLLGTCSFLKDNCQVGLVRLTIQAVRHLLSNSHPSMNIYAFHLATAGSEFVAPDLTGAMVERGRC